MKKNLDMRSIFRCMMEEGYYPTFEKTHILFDLADNTAVVEYEEGVLSVRIFFSIDEEAYDLFLEASNAVMMDTFMVKPAVLDDMKNIMFSCEIPCDTAKEFRKFLQKDLSLYPDYFFNGSGRVLLRRTHPRTAAITEPTSTPSLACASNAAPSAPRPEYERSAMNIDTVNPIPQTTHTLANAFHVVLAGSWTNLSLIASHENEKTPMNFPSTRPSITARPTPEKRLPMLICERSIPAFANAKRGMTKKLMSP